MQGFGVQGSGVDVSGFRVFRRLSCLATAALQTRDKNVMRHRELLQALQTGDSAPSGSKVRFLDGGFRYSLPGLGFRA